MARRRSHTVEIDECVLSWVVQGCLDSYPNEMGAFLIGHRQQKREDYYVVENAYRPNQSINEISCTWHWSEMGKAHLIAARAAKSSEAAKRPVGLIHSHPWNRPYFSAITQSLSDVRLQEEAGFDLSLIVNIWTDPEDNQLRWWVFCWKRGLAMPLWIRVVSNAESYTLVDWVRRHRKVKPWSVARRTAL